MQLTLENKSLAKQNTDNHLGQSPVSVFLYQALEKNLYGKAKVLRPFTSDDETLEYI